jgi:hypothetical protein
MEDRAARANGNQWSMTKNISQVGAFYFFSCHFGYFLALFDDKRYLSGTGKSFSEALFASTNPQYMTKDCSLNYKFIT